MSPSTRSKPASASSPATGEGNGVDDSGPGNAAHDNDNDDAAPVRPSGPVEVELEVSRQQAAGWTIFGVIVGALLVWKLGTVGVWAGIVLIVYGAFRAYELVMSFVHPPGTIVVTDDKVSLPRGLSMSKPIEIKPSDVTAVYFLRRSVPWNKSAPVLVIEIGTRAMAYPRDWFSSEADQRHVVHALMPRQGAVDAAPSTPRVELPNLDGRTALAQLAAGVVLLGVGIAGILIGRAHADHGGQQTSIFIAAIGAGAILLWRGLFRLL